MCQKIDINFEEFFEQIADMKNSQRAVERLATILLCSSKHDDGVTFHHNSDLELSHVTISKHAWLEIIDILE